MFDGENEYRASQLLRTDFLGANRSVKRVHGAELRLLIAYSEHTSRYPLMKIASQQPYL